jgi:DNA-directed RNA polymerase subunit RPC12/RpoP
MKPVCVKCGKEMKIEKSGATALYYAFDPPEPYVVYGADLWECVKCGNQILNGFGREPIWQHFEGNMPNWDKEFLIEIYE